VVEATGAKLVIPIHWDIFFKSLDEPLEPSPPPFDLVDRAMDAIHELAEPDGVVVRTLAAFEMVDLSSSGPLFTGA
jgi:hypothetical protein